MTQKVADSSKRFSLYGPPVLLDTLLLPRLGVLMDLCPDLQPVFDAPVNDARMRGPYIQLSLRRPSNPALVSSRIGELTYSAYAPRDADWRTGWVGNTGPVRNSVSNDFGEKIFQSAPTLLVGTMSLKIKAMKTMGLAGILPDVAGSLDPDLVQLKDLSKGISAPIWLSHTQTAIATRQTETVLEWIQACVAEGGWLNIPSGRPEIETGLSGPHALRYMAGHDRQHPHP